MEFQAWPKIPRLNRDMVITEKIDGTNACIMVVAEAEVTDAVGRESQVRGIAPPETDADRFIIARANGQCLYAQSRKRLIQTNELGGKGADNFGFAQWVRENAEQLVHLGPGRHYGEWWGYGIQRDYGIDHKRFSLFNVARKSYVAAIDGGVLPDNVDLVPVLERYTFDQGRIDTVLNWLRESGSPAAREAGATAFVAAEGIIVYHTAAKQMFKVTLENDEKPKGQS